MKLFAKLACAAAVAFSLVGTASAGTVLKNWKFSPNASGFADAHLVEEYLDINGNAFIQLSPTSASTFNFVEHAVFNIVQADSQAALFPMLYAGGNISIMFEAYGTGTFDGNFTFSGGTIKMYQNPTNFQYGTTAGIFGANLGENIATFDVMAGGGGEVDGSGNPTTNGQVSVFAKASTPGGLMPGYFFRGDGTDLSNEDVLSFAFTNANGVSGLGKNLVGEVACQYAGFTGPGCGSGTYANKTGEYFFVSNNGQFKLAEVPEPGSLALFGLAILGAGVVSRKRKQA